MSMHEFEDLVEQSVRLLDAAHDARLHAERPARRGLGPRVATPSDPPGGPDPDLRSAFHALYAFQGRWDTGFTHFRVIGILVKHRFAYVFDLEEHPHYAALGGRVLGDDKTLSVLRDPTKPWDEETNPAVGYACDPVAEWGPKFAAAYPPELRRMRLYCDAGSELWQRFVAAGKLVGADAVAPLEVPIERVAAWVVREAEIAGNRDLVCEWMALLFADRMHEDLETLMVNPSILDVRAVAKRLGILDRETDYGDTRVPSDDDLADGSEEDLEKARWWFAVGA